MEKKREDGVIVRETRNLVNDLSYRFADAGDVLLDKEVKALKGVHRGLSVFWSVPMLVEFGLYEHIHKASAASTVVIPICRGFNVMVF